MIQFIDSENSTINIYNSYVSNVVICNFVVTLLTKYFQFGINKKKITLADMKIFCRRGGFFAGWRIFCRRGGFFAGEGGFLPEAFYHILISTVVCKRVSEGGSYLDI